MEISTLQKLIFNWTLAEAGQKILIEGQLKKLIEGNQLYSREQIFQMKGLAPQLHFIPGSKSFNNYGEYISLLGWSEETLEQIIPNISANPVFNSFGNIKGRIMDRNEREIQDAIFSTKEIHRII